MDTHANPETRHKRLTKCGCSRSSGHARRMVKSGYRDGLPGKMIAVRRIDPRPTLSVRKRHGRRGQRGGQPLTEARPGAS